MIDTLSSAVLAWLLTYLIHSTALLVLAWGITRVRIWSPGATDLFWKAALVGGLVSASVQLALELRPAGSVSIASPALAVPTPTAHAARTEPAARSGGEGIAATAAAFAMPIAAAVPAT